MRAKDIEKYLFQLGQELVNQGIQQPIHVLLIGGAYMLLLANSPRSTDDVDIFWLEDEQTLQHTLSVLLDGAHKVAENNHIDPDWFNYMAHLLMYDLVTMPNSKLWKKFGRLHVYVPPREYILALKILAGRQKDIEDCKILLKRAKVKTRQQAQQLLDRYILPATQAANADQIEQSLTQLFGEP